MDTISRRRPSHATAKARNVAAIPEVLLEFGVDVPAILQSAGLDPDLFHDLENVIPYAALGRLVMECVKATGCESFGLRVGAKTKRTALGLTSLVSINSPTVRDALRIITDTLKTSETGGMAFLDVRDGLASFGYAVTAPDIECVDQIEDGSLAIAFNMMRQLCGPAWRPSRVRLTRDPPRDRGPFMRFFDAPVDFAEPCSCLIFDAATLEAPIGGRDPDTAEILIPLLEEAAARAPSDFLSSVKSIIRSQIAAGTATRNAVARALGLNPRTLANRLGAFGVTFSSLAEEARFEAATGLLAKNKRIAEVASHLGFAEQSAFTRAFKKWSGMTPGRWRLRRAGAIASADSKAAR